MQYLANFTMTLSGSMTMTGPENRDLNELDSLALHEFLSRIKIVKDAFDGEVDVNFTRFTELEDKAGA